MHILVTGIRHARATTLFAFESSPRRDLQPANRMICTIFGKVRSAERQAFLISSNINTRTVTRYGCFLHVPNAA